MSKIFLSKSFKFEAAHRLAKGYEGKCANIHGHSWKGEVSLSCPSLDQFGMGIDFEEIKQFLRVIVAHFDHKIILYKDDQAIIGLCQAQNWDYVVFDDENPTSERVAKYIFEEAQDYFSKLNPAITVHQVVIEETCSSKCVWVGS